MSVSLLQPGDEKECFLTGCQSGLDKHHIYGGVANRKLSERYGCWVWLKHSLHMELHDKDKKVDRYLKRECQKAFEERYSREKFMTLFGRNYLMEEDE